MSSARMKNADRFKGFAEIYEKARPCVPEYPVKAVCRYLGRKPDVVVDLGCGTGLSTFAWESVSNAVIGIEPSDDMLSVAKLKGSDKVKFIQAFSDNTGLPDTYADVAVCSQSFHWMEPSATLKEVNRILKPGGVFAAIDCDWPPVTQWQAEKEYMTLYNKVKRIEEASDKTKNTFVRYSKEHHLKNISQSGYFRYSRELLFSSTEKCTAQRFINIILSQGSLQTVLKYASEDISRDIDAFKKNICDIFGHKEFEIEFCYRMRVGIK